jgi:hypothetical protein
MVHIIHVCWLFSCKNLDLIVVSACVRENALLGTHGGKTYTSAADLAPSQCNTSAADLAPSQCNTSAADLAPSQCNTSAADLAPLQCTRYKLILMRKCSCSCVSKKKIACLRQAIKIDVSNVEAVLGYAKFQVTRLSAFSHLKLARSCANGRHCRSFIMSFTWSVYALTCTVSIRTCLHMYIRNFAYICTQAGMPVTAQHIDAS